jgi:truncated hemoglobin YjbI
MNNKFNDKYLDNEHDLMDFLTQMIGSVKNQLEHERGKPVSYREAMEAMKLNQQMIDGIATKFNIDANDSYDLAKAIEG